MPRQSFQPSVDEGALSLCCMASPLTGSLSGIGNGVIRLHACWYRSCDNTQLDACAHWVTSEGPAVPTLSKTLFTRHPRRQGQQLARVGSTWVGEKIF